MSRSADQQKWNRIYTEGDHGSLKPARVLAENTHLLPDSGRALDLACGHGANALLLARQGLTASAWDISQVALDMLAAHARDQDLQLQLEARDVSAQPPEKRSFDVIVVSRFLDRELMPHLAMALRNGGLIYYQTFTRESVSEGGPRNPAYRLGRNELLNFFPDLQILYYREEGTTGDTTRGFRNEAMLIARKIMMAG